MSLNAALAKIQSLGAVVMRTNDAAAIWSVSPATASTMLARLGRNGHVRRLKQGIWLLEKNAHPWTLHQYLSDPAPSYLSLQTALFHHEMIDQIPTTIHVISTAKTNTIKTPVGTYAIHRVAPPFFCGYEPLSGGPAQVAVPEKALVDFFYFRPTRSRDFRALPEIDIPEKFSKKKALTFSALIGSKSRRAMVERLLTEVIAR
jgi:predicted transcriptional regulator of viral defense system